VVLICSDAPPIRRCACWLGICWLGDCWLGVCWLGARWLLEGLAVRQSLILSFWALVSLAQCSWCCSGVARVLLLLQLPARRVLAR